MEDSAYWRSLPPRSAFRELARAPYLSFLYGFQTGANYWAPDTYNMFAGHTPTTIFALLDEWCDRNPTGHFASGLVELSVELHRSRQRTSEQADKAEGK